MLTQSPGLFCFSHHPQKLGGDTADPRAIPYHTTKLGKEGGRGEHSEGWHSSSQVNVTHDGVLLSWIWLNTCLPMRSSELIPCFDLFACLDFALPIKLSLSQSTSFLTFTLPILFPMALEVQAVVWCLAASQG